MKLYSYNTYFTFNTIFTKLVKTTLSVKYRVFSRDYLGKNDLLLIYLRYLFTRSVTIFEFKTSFSVSKVRISLLTIPLSTL